MAVKPSDLTKRNQEYWAKREEKKSSRWFATESTQIRKKNRIYDKTMKDMDKEINAFYAKYGTIKEAPKIQAIGTGVVATESEKALVITMAEASKKRGKMTRLQWLKLQLNDMIKPLYGEQKADLVDYLSNVARENYYESIYEGYRGVGVGTSFNVINDAAVSQLIRTPIRGANFSERYTINRNKLANNVSQVLTDGIIKGVSNKDMVKDLTNRMGIDKANASRIIRTELANTMNQSNLAGYEAGGIVKQYEYIATLDNRTSDQCQELDGEVFDTDKAVPGLNFPPVHPNCRSTTAIALDTQTKQGLTRIARDANTGKTFLVPANMNYKEFKEKYLPKEVNKKLKQVEKIVKPPKKTPPKPKVSKPKQIPIEDKKWVITDGRKIIGGFDTKKEAREFGMTQRKEGATAFLFKNEDLSLTSVKK